MTVPITHSRKSYDSRFLIFQLYVLEDTNPPASPAKKTSRELSGTLRNLKKIEQALQMLDSVHVGDEDLVDEDEDDEDVLHPDAILPEEETDAM